uniref:non-specific lipid-transfer protein-like n=1 Tax=Erigeron canadensis TaxID=72917 RepID=UPI001CB8FE6E|nr:non-specific lipid-transfer protein-like [Erigeron canadensis]
MDRIRIMWAITIIGAILISSKLMVVFAVPSCSMVAPMLPSCLGFIEGLEPSGMCCSTVKYLKDLGKTKNDRVAICECLKQATRMISYDPKRIPLLSKKCGVHSKLPPVDKDYDCSRVR